MAHDHRLQRTVVVPLPREQVFEFFADAENLERITPPSLKFSITTPLPIDMREGALIEYRLTLLGIPFRWVTKITRWDPPNEFVDEQLSGPYRQWIHTHTFRDVEGGTEIVDEVRYRLPLWPFGEAALPIVRLQLRGIFDHRQRAVRRLLLEDEG